MAGSTFFSITWNRRSFWSHWSRRFPAILGSHSVASNLVNWGDPASGLKMVGEKSRLHSSTFMQGWGDTDVKVSDLRIQREMEKIEAKTEK